MIANRQSKLQMRSELSLFLRGQTAKFTDWLHAVLEKLEAYTASSNLPDSLKDSSTIVKEETGTISEPTTSLIPSQLATRAAELENSEADNSCIETGLKHPELIQHSGMWIVVNMCE
jgi:hypothetical protein